MSSDAKAQDGPPSSNIIQAPTVTAPSPSPPLSTDEGGRPLPLIGIAIMGATGSGKSSFINTASDSQLQIGNDLGSCTVDVELSQEFILDGRRVFLMDTPGFDDTNVSDADILKKIAAFLAVTYEKGYKLAGIIYVHRISDDRFTGASTRNFRVFRKLCGEEAMKNVTLMTNMWGWVEKGVGEAREKELLEVHFKSALDKGAQHARHYNTPESAHEIIRRIMENDPTPLLIQKELVDEEKGIEKTAAGEAVNRELNKALARHEAEMEEIRQEMRKALEEKDEQAAKEMKEEADKLKKQMDKMRAEGKTMGVKYDEERKRMEMAVAAKHNEEWKKMEMAAMAAKQNQERKRMERDLAAKFEEERKRMEAVIAAKYDKERKRADRAAQRMQDQALQERQKAQEEHTKQIDELRAKLEVNASASADVRKELLRRIRKLEGRQPPKKSGTCVVM